MKKHFLIPALIIISFILPFNNYALEEAQDEIGEELKLYLGEAKIIPINNPTRIAVGNPNIADVVNVTTTEMTLNPKAVGTTRLVFWDNFGEQAYLVRVVPENMSEIKRRVDNILKKLEIPEVYTQLAEEEGKILILGKVKTPQERERINLALGTLKDKITELLLVKEEETGIEIDVQVLELNKDATKTLGFSWPGSITATEIGSPAITSRGAVDIVTGTTPGTAYTETTPGTKWSTFFKVLNLTRPAFVWSLDALVQEGKARILSRPRLACQSGKEAELMVGGEKPTFATYTSQVSTGVQIEYKEYGIKLKIKPTVIEDERIKLVLNVGVSDIGEAETIGSTTSVTAKAYPLIKRNVTTELFVNNGQTLAIGGLIKQKSEEDIRKVPWLADIPVLGLFFRRNTKLMGGGAGTRGDTELFITLTPTIIPSKEEPLQPKEKTPGPESGALSVQESVPFESTPDFTTIMGYSRIVQKRILESLSYPAAAKEAGFQGTLKLALHLSYLGELLDVEVRSSSGYKVLDDNAVSVAKDIAQYPPFPPSIEKKELWVEIPIIYRLD